MMKQACARGQSVVEWLGPGKQVGVDTQRRSDVIQAHGTTENSYFYFYSNRHQWWGLKDVTSSSSK